MPVAQQFDVLENLKRGVVQAATNQPVGAVCIEGLDMARSYGGQIERTVLWWKVVETIHRLGIPVFVAPSAQLKMYATGKGSAFKSQIIEALDLRWPFFEHDKDDNKADAAVCALVAAHMVDQPIHPVPPNPQLDAPHLRALVSVCPITDPPRRVRPKLTTGPLDM